MYHLHMHRYKGLHICKRFSLEEALQLAAFIKQQQPNVKVPWQSIPSPVTLDSVWRERNPGWMNGVTGPEHVAFKWPALLCSPDFSGTSCSQLEWATSVLKENEYWERVAAVCRTNAVLRYLVHVHFFRLTWESHSLKWFILFFLIWQWCRVFLLRSCM